MAAQEQAGRRRGGTVGDLIRTLVIFVLLAVAIVAIIPRHTRDDPTVDGIDVPAAAAQVQNSVSFHVYVPRGLPADWQPNHAIPRVAQPGQPVASLDVGYFIKGANNYAALEQSNAPGFVTAQLGAGAPTLGTVVVGGVEFTRRTDQHGQPALVRTVPGGSTLVLDGQATLAQLELLAAALR